MTEIMIILALAGSIAAGLWDLKTTEVPDEIPVLMTAAGIFYWYTHMISTGDHFPLLVSAISGTLIALVGYLLYRAGKWGGADAFVFAAIAYMLPVYNNRIFIIDYSLNFIIVSGLYMLVYSLALGMLNPKIFGHFFKDIRKNWKIVLLPAFYFAVIFATNNATKLLLFYGFVLSLLVIFWRYAVVIEEKVFKKKVSVTKLMEGDVLEKMIWRGLTKEEIREIKRKEKYVVVKEGVRFIPAFAINLAVTLLYGNVLFLIFPI